MIPDTHPTPNAMARCLISYIADDRRVRREVLSEFSEAPELESIARMREQRRAQEDMARRGRQAPGFTARGWDWRGEREQIEMAAASGAFLSALAREAR